MNQSEMLVQYMYPYSEFIDLHKNISLILLNKTLSANLIKTTFLIHRNWDIRGISFLGKALIHHQNRPNSKKITSFYSYCNK